MIGWGRGIILVKGGGGGGFSWGGMLGKGLMRLKLGGGFCMRDEDMRGRKEGRVY